MEKERSKNVIYYPMERDSLYNQEVESVLNYCVGKGMDIGCGGRSINPDLTRVDIDPKKEPDILAPMNKIPVEDESFDYIVAQHVLEHTPDPIGALKEWLRIVKKGGWIIIIHPDVQWTLPQKPPEDNPSIQADPYNKHYKEQTQAEFKKWIMPLETLGFKVVEIGEAGRHWSFKVILRKNTR